METGGLEKFFGNVSGARSSRSWGGIRQWAVCKCSVSEHLSQAHSSCGTVVLPVYGGSGFGPAVYSARERGRLPRFILKTERIVNTVNVDE